MAKYTRTKLARRSPKSAKQDVVVPIIPADTEIPTDTEMPPPSLAEVSQMRAWFHETYARETPLTDAQIASVIEVSDGPLSPSNWAARMQILEDQLEGQEQIPEDNVEVFVRASARVSDYVAKLQADKVLLHLAWESGEQKLRSKVIPFEASDRLLAIYGEKVIINEWPDINTCAHNVPNKRGLLTKTTNNPEFAMIGGKGNRDKRSSFYAELFADTADGEALIKKIEQEERKKADESKGIEYDDDKAVEAYRARFNAAVNVLRQGAWYLKQRHAILEAFDNVTITEGRKEESQEWISSMRPLTLHPGRNKPTPFRYMGLSTFTRISVKDAMTTKANNPKKSDLECILDTLKRDPTRKEDVPAMTRDNMVSGLSGVFHFFNNEDNKRYVQRMLSSDNAEQRTEILSLFCSLYDVLNPFLLDADWKYRGEPKAKAEEKAKATAA